MWRTRQAPWARRSRGCSSARQALVVWCSSVSRSPSGGVCSLAAICLERDSGPVQRCCSSPPRRSRRSRTPQALHSSRAATVCSASGSRRANGCCSASGARCFSTCSLPLRAASLSSASRMQRRSERRPARWCRWRPLPPLPPQRSVAALAGPRSPRSMRSRRSATAAINAVLRARDGLVAGVRAIGVWRARRARRAHPLSPALATGPIVEAPALEAVSDAVEAPRSDAVEAPGGTAPAAQARGPAHRRPPRRSQEAQSRAGSVPLLGAHAAGSVHAPGHRDLPASARRGSQLRPRQPDHEFAHPREEARGLRRAGPCRDGASWPGDHDVRVRARLRRQGESHHQSRRRPGARAARSVGAHHRAAAWQVGGRVSRFRIPSATSSTSATCSSPRTSGRASRSSRSRSARTSSAIPSKRISRRCRTCWSRVPPAPARASSSTRCSARFCAAPSPDELKLLLIDPKILELSIYEGIPHLIADVVTNPKRASAALHGIVLKMEERYRVMAALGVRNILQFNERVDELLADGQTMLRLKPRPGEEEGQLVPIARIPYIVVVIDELADLMVVSARDVEEALQRLAQMARAAGIHLVLATQRPSVDVLTGVIKANFPSRISFQVVVEDRLAHDHGPERRGASARPGRHALPAARNLEAAAHARRLRLREGSRRAGGASCARRERRASTRR